MSVFLETFQPAANCMSWQQQSQQLQKVAESLSPKVSIEQSYADFIRTHFTFRIIQFGIFYIANSKMLATFAFGTHSYIYSLALM